MFEWLTGEPYPVLKAVILNTKTGRAFRGVLWQKRRDYLVLKDAELLQGKGETTRIDGELIVDRQNVDFMQVL